MTEASRRAALATVCQRAGLTDDEHYFVQTVVRLSSIQGILTDNALAIRTVTFTAPWASSLHQSHLAGHLRLSHAEKAVASALAACDGLAPLALHLPTCTRWRAILSLLSPNPTSASRPVFNVTSAEVEAHQRDIASLVLGGHSLVAIARPLLERLAAEIAIHLISRASDVERLVEDMQNLRADRPDFRAALTRTLLRPNNLFHVIIPVSGASTFESLNTLKISAEIRQVSPRKAGTFSGWGISAAGANDFVQNFFATREDRPQGPRRRQTLTLLSATLQATDMRAAAAAGRRTIIEALDYYVASHPFADFEIGRDMGVIRSGEPKAQLVSLSSSGEETVRPMVISLPDSLRQAMRVAHLLRDTDAPMTRVALAWVVIESSGFLTSDVQALGKMLALTSLRQFAFAPYRTMAQDALDRQVVKDNGRRARYQRSKALRWLRKCDDLHDRPDILLIAKRSVVRSQFLAGLYGLLQHKAEIESSRKRRALGELDGLLNLGATSEFYQRTFLGSLTAWARLLSEGPSLSPSKEFHSLRTLLDAVTVPTRVTVEELAMLAQSGPLAGQRLASSHAWFIDLLNAFYAARNLNLHSGVFGSEGDVALGELAVLIADLLFETWDYWYSNQSGPTSAVRDVVAELAMRYDRLTSFLLSGGSLADVDLDQLTGPSWHPAAGV
jgi:hypothetical protein